MLVYSIILSPVSWNFGLKHKIKTKTVQTSGQVYLVVHKSFLPVKGFNLAQGSSKIFLTKLC